MEAVMISFQKLFLCHLHLKMAVSQDLYQIFRNPVLILDNAIPHLTVLISRIWEQDY